MQGAIRWVVCLNFVTQAFAQSNCPWVIGAQGESSRLPTIQVDWHLGEIVAETAAGSGNILTQGFIQPNSDTLILSIADNSPVCTDGLLSLSATDIPGASYTWAGPNGFTSNGRVISRNPVSIQMGGVYTVTATRGLATGIATHTVSVLVAPTVSVSPSGTIVSCTGNPVLLTASGGSSYLWSNASTDQTLSVLSDGTFTVTGTNGNGCLVTSPMVTVQFYPGLSNNLVAGTQTLCSGQTPALLTGSLPSGGDGSSFYQWQTSSDNSSWGDINGATQQDFSPALPAGNSYYRRLLSSGNCAVSTSASVSITRLFSIGDNTIGNDQTLCTAGLPAILTGTTPTGGNGIYAYLWQTSADNSTWSTHPGTSLNLTPEFISSNTYYRRTVSSTGCPSVNSNVVTVSRLVGQNIISSSQTIPYNTSPSGLSGIDNINSPGYVWETSHNNYHWQVIPGANQSGFQPGVLIQHAWYRRKLAGIGCPDTLVSNLVTITLNMDTDTALTASSNSPICAGAPLYLNAQGPANSVYQWYGPNGFSSSVQNPSFTLATEPLSGVYRVRVTKPNGDTASVTVNVLVGSSLNNFQVLYNNPICAGSTLMVSASYLPRVGYSWSGPNGFTSESAVNYFPNAQPSLNGVYSIVATSPGCLSISRTVSVVVNPPLNPVPGSNGPLCTGSVLNLTCFHQLGASYFWQGPNGFTSTSDRPSISNVQTIHSGVYTVTVTGLGCTSVTQSHSVLVNPSIVSLIVSNNSPVCQGNSIVLSIPAYTGATYTWLGPNGFTGSNSNILTRTNAQPNFTGIYTLTAVVPGCGTAVRTSTVTVNSLSNATVGSNSPICFGANLSLTTTPVSGATYSWSGPGGYASTSQNPVISRASPANSGVYSLTVSIPSCGSGVYTTQVQVNTPPASVSVSGNSPVCVGSTLTMTAGLLANASYSWTGPSGFSATGNAQSIANAQAANAGTYSVNIVVPACPSALRTFKVVVNGGSPVVASVNTPACLGSVVIFNATPINGATYAWTGPNGFTSVIQNPNLTNVQVIQAGTYSVVATVVGCGTSSSTVSLVVADRPGNAQVSAAQTICTPAPITLTGSTVPGATVSWAGPNGFTASGTSFTIPSTTMANGGVYSYFVVTPTCGTAIRNVTVTTLNTSMISGAAYPTPQCAGGVLYLSSGFVAGATYSWAGPGGYTSGLQSPSRIKVSPTMSGTYTQTVNIPGCGAVQRTYPVVINNCRTAGPESEETLTLPTDEFSELNLVVYPNPTDGKTEVKATGLEGPFRMRILDVLGHEVLIPGRQNTEGGTTVWELDFGRLPKGVYLIRLEMENGEMTERVLVR